MPERAPALPLLCPSCDHVNPEGSKFCNQCGMPVDFRECALCQAINDGAARLCYKCGNSLLMTPPPVSVREALPEQEPETSAFVAIEAWPATATVRRRSTGMTFAVVGVCLAALAIPAYIAYQDIEPMRPAAPESPAETGTVPEAIATPPSSATDATAAARVVRPDPTTPETPAETKTVLEAIATPPSSATDATAAATVVRPDERRASESPPPPVTTSGSGAAPPGPKAVPKKKATSRQGPAKSKRNKDAGSSGKN